MQGQDKGQQDAINEILVDFQYEPVAVQILHACPDISKEKLEHLKRMLEVHADARTDVYALARRLYTDYHGETIAGTSSNAYTAIQNNILEMIASHESSEKNAEQGGRNGNAETEPSINEEAEQETPRRSGSSIIG